MRSQRRGQIANACVLRAIRIVSHDSDWAPAAVVDLIEQYQGYPLAALDLLADYAPLVIWRQTDSVEIETWANGAKIADASGREQTLAANDTLAVCFENSFARGHVEAITISEIATYFHHPVVALLTYDTEYALLWKYCATCEMVMPPAHTCSVERECS